MQKMTFFHKLSLASFPFPDYNIYMFVQAVTLQRRPNKSVEKSKEPTESYRDTTTAD